MKRFLRAVITALLLTAVIIAASFYIPFAASFENGPIENTQAVILFCGTIYALWCSRRDEWQALRHVDCFAAGLLFFLGLRELSYGRVFFPVGMGPKGPEFIAMHDVPGHEVIYALLGVYMLTLFYVFLRDIPWRAIIACRISWTPWVLALTGAVLSALGDKDVFGPLERSQVIEELAEVMLYLSLVWLFQSYRRLLRN